METETIFGQVIAKANHYQAVHTLDRLILHQIPFRPRAVEESRMAAGIRAEVRITLSTAGGMVRPSPKKAPDVMISIHMKSSDTPRI